MIHQYICKSCSSSEDVSLCSKMGVPLDIEGIIRKIFLRVLPPDRYYDLPAPTSRWWASPLNDAINLGV